MSAIVAKAINDSLGTEDFEGLNTIMDKQLQKVVHSLDDFVQNLPPKIEEAIKAASNTILSPSNTDLYYDVLLEAGGEKQYYEGQIGRNFTFKCNGAINVLLMRETGTGSTVGSARVYVKKNDQKIMLYNVDESITPTVKGKIIPILPNDVVSFHVEKSNSVTNPTYVGLSELKIRATVIPNASVIIS